MSQRIRKPKQVFTPEQTKNSKNSVSQHHDDENNHGLNDASHDENLPTSIAHDEETPECQLYCICKQPYDGYSVMIDCERCKEYYHTTCIHLDVEITDDSVANFEYFCNGCIQELTNQVHELEEELEEQKYSADKKDTLISQHDSEIEALKKKHTVKVENMQKDLTSKVKALEDKFSKCDDQRKQNQKDLTNSKNAAQALSEKLAKCESNLRGVQLNYSNSHRQLDVVRKTNSANEATILSLQTNMKDLENQLKVQKEINTGLINSHSGNDDQVNAVQEPTDTQSTSIISPPTSTDTLQESQKKLKNKCKELETAHGNIKYLEEILSNTKVENTSLADQLDAAKAEIERLRRMNDLLLPEEDPSAVNGLSTHSFLQTQFNTSQVSDESVSHNDDLDVSNMNDTLLNPESGENTLRNTETCPGEWYNHQGYCNRTTCSLDHNIDFVKLNTVGFCFHEFFKKGSCRHQTQCKYCHQIPMAARNDPKVKEHVQAKIQKGRERKLKPTNRNDNRTTNHSIHSIPRVKTSTATPSAPFLMNIVTPYEQVNGHVNDPSFIPRNNCVRSSDTFTNTNIDGPSGTNDLHNAENFSVPVSSPSTTFTPTSTQPMSLHFLGQLIQNVVSRELQKRFPSPLPNTVIA